jgi:hypothetical protein
MWSWRTFWLVLHILSVIVAFGPTFAFGLMAAYGQKNPRFAVASAEISQLIEKRLVYPGAVVVAIAGTGLIYTSHVNLWASEWLIIAIVLYTLIFAFSFFVQTPNDERLVELLRSMSSAAEGSPESPAGPGGPPPEVAALGRKLQLGGIAMTIGFVTILVLMVWRPGDCRGIC